MSKKQQPWRNDEAENKLASVIKPISNEAWLAKIEKRRKLCVKRKRKAYCPIDGNDDSRLRKS